MVTYFPCQRIHAWQQLVSSIGNSGQDLLYELRCEATNQVFRFQLRLGLDVGHLFCCSLNGDLGLPASLRNGLLGLLVGFGQDGALLGSCLFLCFLCQILCVLLG